MRRASQAIFIAGLCFFALASVRADTFTVTTTDELGPGSLGEAISQANAHPGADTIAFNIPGDGVQQITVSDTGLPEITDPVTIDGYTQPGAQANTLAVGDDAIILIRIDGLGSYATNGLLMSGGDSVVRGLNVTSFPNAIKAAISSKGISSAMLSTDIVRRLTSPESIFRAPTTPSAASCQHNATSSQITMT